MIAALVVALSSLGTGWLAAGVFAQSAGVEGVEYDIIISGGTIIDGSGIVGYAADVGIKDGYIYAVGDLSRATARRWIAAQGLFVAPGFIDTHSHAETALLATPLSSLTQGVTTEILNPDGEGPTNVGDLLHRLEAAGLGINVGAFIGFNAAWSEVVGNNYRRPTEAQVDAMRAIIAKGMQDGALGVSSGLFYAPAVAASTEEVTAVVEAARPWRAVYSTHMRDESFGLLAAMTEAVDIGLGAGLTPDITHMKVGSPYAWGKAAEAVGIIKQANASGTYVTASVYPYTASSTSLTAIVPPWVQEGGRSAMLQRFRDRARREQIAREIEDYMRIWVRTADQVYFPEQRRTLADEAARMGVSAGEAVIRILEEGNRRTIYHFGSEADLAILLANPYAAVASDGGATNSNAVHPRRYGTFPRVLGRYVREQGILTWQDAVRKMTGLPATLLGLVDRGFIAVGMAADIVVFDPKTIIDRATFDSPRQYAEGVHYVLVNGQVAYEHGRLTDVRAGIAIRKHPNAPSRPMNPPHLVQAMGTGSISLPDPNIKLKDVSFDFALRQHPDEARATGFFRMKDWAGEVELVAVDLGKLQVADGWASFTGLGLVNGRDLRVFRVIVDEHDPFAGGQTTVSVWVHGVLDVSGPLAFGSRVAVVNEP